MVNIQKACLNELSDIVKFQIAMAYETEKLILNEEIVYNGVKKIIDNEDLGFYLVALSVGKPVASLLCLYEWSDWRNAFIIWIHSVYVLPEYRKKQVFRMLFNHLKLHVENDEQYRGIRLYVDKRNNNAQMVYKKMGMTNEHYELFEWLK